MKNILFPVALIILLASCKKSTDSQAGSTSGARLISAKGYVSGVLQSLDTFIYNNDGYLLTQRQESFSNGVSNGGFSLTFNYSGTSSDPVSYTLNDGYGVNTFSLTYNANGRLVKDTLIPDVTNNSSTFSYPGNNIAYSSYGNGSADTFYIANGNVVKTVQASIPPDPSSDIIDNFTYNNNYPNPFYTTGQTDNVRLLVTKVDSWEFLVNDCISKNAFTSVNENSGVAYQVSYTTDASGKVTKATVFNLSEVFSYK